MHYYTLTADGGVTKLIKSIIEVTGASQNDSQIQLELVNSQKIQLVKGKIREIK